MARQRTRDTRPELALRRALHAGGYRYRVNLPIPGLSRQSIDIAFTRARVAVFVDGCFWHRCPTHRTEPKNNAAWWRAKLLANEARDRVTDQHLRDAGWTVIRCWEHESPADAYLRVALAVDAAGTGM